MDDPSAARSFDKMLDALADVQRRKLLVALLDHNPQDDSPVVADSETEAGAIKRLVEMEHVHLPKSEEYGFIERDQQTHEVAKGRNFDEIRPLLELLADDEDGLPDDWL